MENSKRGSQQIPVKFVGRDVSRVSKQYGTWTHRHQAPSLSRTNIRWNVRASPFCTSFTEAGFVDGHAGELDVISGAVLVACDASCSHEKCHSVFVNINTLYDLCGAAVSSKLCLGHQNLP
ncbi:hypothetical protein XU18_1422 [Perkinsela sp. CCAP 1560/4]|nr:hypothetical protein XU18_1422 [Perkinsela sp. CCAP 1560/4]|eukprot:KNH07990.1 hypothetical protein XU18_1422 [Perkinsela sp. CCAP 1560/4]